MQKHYRRVETDIKFYDTCSLLQLMDKAFDEHFVCSDITLHELEQIKTSRNKTEALRYKARKLTHLLDEHMGEYEVVVWRTSFSEGLSDSNDIKIIECAYTYSQDNEMIFVTEDICAKNIAAAIFGLQVESVGSVCEDVYKGYRIIEGDAAAINKQMEDMDITTWNTNEYLIIQNTDDGSVKEMRFDGTKFVSLRLPPSKYIKAKNSLQRCALDILMNPDITIAAILGGYGSGKTYLSMQMALYIVNEKGHHSKILGIREPRGEGREVGYLPGSLEEKTDNFFLPLVQQLDGKEFELESLKQRGVLESNIPFYMKGTTYNNTIILVDEAEDLDEKQIRLIGTRLGENSKIYFSGDYKQSVINSSDNNALIKMCNEFKGKPQFGCIYLGEDVRSETSKLFADLFNSI